jgi:dipeptidyl-peptidase 4
MIRKIAEVSLRPHAEDYERAERFLSHNVDRLVLNETEPPTWLPSGKFWYRTRTAQGHAYWLVDPRLNVRKPMFDHRQVALALANLPDGPDEQGDLQFDAIELSADEKSISFRIECRRWQCGTDGTGCRSLPELTPDAVLSPDRMREVFIREHNLWVRDISSGSERPLTTDGITDFGYATDSNSKRHTDRACVHWSPDSKRLATFQQDQRGVSEMHLVSPQRGHPTLETWKYSMPGDAVIPTVHRVIIDVDVGRVVRLQMPPDLVRSAAWFGLGQAHSGELEGQWSADSASFAFISIARAHRCARLRLADAADGAVRDVLEERTATYYESTICASHALRPSGAANWRYLPASSEVIWYSSRDNWSHLYLYDLATGQLKHQITAGEWNVVNVLTVDERRRVIYFVAVGRETQRHPHFEHLYRVDFDGGNLRLLTPENAAHAVSVAPGGDYFVDSYSTPQTAPIAVLRNHGGELVRTLETADISRLLAIGWQPPTPVTVKARDGVTDLYGLLLKPSNFDETRRYPVVNAIYASPIMGSVFTRGRWYWGQWGVFSATYGVLADAHCLAELGFVVVMIDGMGTPLRSRAFHEALYGKDMDGTLPDQVAAMKELARRYAWIDLDRVGVYGHSAGGSAAARALLAHAEFFKVGVSISGAHHPQSYTDEYYEKYAGPSEKEASHAAVTPANVDLAANLRGRLLLVHGMMDANVVPYHTLLLADALIQANKDFDLLLLPQTTHEVSVEKSVSGRYLERRLWDYFVRHLLGVEPPVEFHLSEPARGNTPRIDVTDPALSTLDC